MRCGKALVIPTDPNNPTQLNTMLGHYLVDEQLQCIECHDGEADRKEKGKSFHNESWDFKYLV